MLNIFGERKQPNCKYAGIGVGSKALRGKGVALHCDKPVLAG